MQNTMRKWTCLALLASLALLSGCNHLAFWGYLITPEPTETIAAQFDQLDGKTVAVIVYAGESIQYAHPTVSREVSAQVSAELHNQLPNVTTVDPLKIHKYQQQNIHWASLSKTELGRLFDADYVLFVTLLEFSTREQGSLHLFRGRLSAECAIYEVQQPEYAARGWETSGISVLYPTDGPIASLNNDDYRVRLETIGEFAWKLVRNFYEHEVPKAS